MGTKPAFGILLGMFMTVFAFAQDRPRNCQSALQVAPGGFVVIDCRAQTEGYNTYEWVSRDPSWLTFLSDVGVASPRFHAPVNVETPLQLVYDRLVFDGEGKLMHQETVMITVQEDQFTGSGGLKDLRWGESEWIGLDELGPEEIRAENIAELIGTDDTVPDQLPFLRCESRITVDSEELVEIPCTGLHPSGGLLAYRFEFDWPPYSETRMLGEGTFAYLVRAPMIQGAASVQMLEVFAQVPGNGQEVSEQVEVHIVNRTPQLVCEDITVDEGMQTPIPCSVTPRKATRIQLLSELAPRGVHDHWPMIAIPEVHRDTSFSVMARVFGAKGGSVVEDEFTVTVQDAQTPLDLDVTCNVDPHPLPYEEYEGAGPAELTISCGLTSIPSGPLVWSLSADGGDTPIDPLSRIIDIFQNPQTYEFSFVVALPQEVDGNIVWQYGVLVVENVDDGEEFTDREEISITILERPDISIECDDVRVRTGNPPLELMCTPSLDVTHRDGTPDYLWNWTSGNGMDLLSGDLTSAMPVFNVPANQDQPTVEYTYQVTASADNTDPPQNPATLTVTVEKYLGKLAVQCTSPIEVYEGEQDFPLDCALSGPDVSDLSWTWQLQEGPEDRLVEGASGAPPIFRTPGDVENTETYKYEIRAEAPFYDTSEPELVEIIVLRNPQLSIECDDVRVRMGDPPLELMCTPSLDVPHRDGTPDYVWSWTSENGLDLLSGDLTSAVPVFNVPASQDPATVEYTYHVTASADNIDPPQNPATLTVTVEKYLGKLAVQCTSPIEVYAGEEDFPLDCALSGSNVSDLSWTWQLQEGPEDRLVEGASGAPPIFRTPEDVEDTQTYKYEIRAEAPFYDASEPELVDITVLRRPQLSIECDDVRVRTGDSPLALVCTPSLDVPHRDGTPNYLWSWTSENGLDLLSGDLTSAMPVFNVPASQDPATVEYTYQVTASADNIDPPQNPATLTVTVEKYLGKLAVQCTSPIEVYAGEEDFPLDCALSGPDVSDLSWTWQLQDGPEDRLVEGASGAPPIFRTPGDVENTETYKYEIRAEAPFYDASEPELVEITVLRRPQLSIECDDVRVRTGDPPLELMCTPSLDVPHRDGTPDYLWSWTSENGLDLLSGDLTSAMPVFNVPASQNPATVEYTYQVNASADNIDPPHNPATLTVTVEKYPIFLECPEEVVVTAGMPPQRIMCSATSEPDAALEYVWQWTPTERLSNTSTGGPLFDVPARQRVYSRSYPYTVMVSAERGISAEASVTVIVLRPSQGLVEQVEISSSELDFGVAGPDGEVLMDPATEQLSGLVYEVGQSHAGRMMIQARDSVTLSMEQVQSSVLRHIDSGRELTLVPRIAYSPSCTTFSAYTQASRVVQTLLVPGDCHVLRIGGNVTLGQADPGAYSGKVSVVITVNGVDQLHTIPVELTVEPQRRTVLLGPGGVRFNVARLPVSLWSGISILASSHKWPYWTPTRG